MAETVLMKNRVTGEVEYPVTHKNCIIADDGSDITTKKEVDTAIADFVDSTPERIETIDNLKEKLDSDDNAAVAVVNAIGDAKKALVVDIWESRGGKYNKETDFFELNGLTDVTTPQAIRILDLYVLCHQMGPSDFGVRRFVGCSARTLFPISYYNVYTSLGSALGMFANIWPGKNFEVIVFGGDSYCYMFFNSWQNAFSNQTALREVRGIRFNKDFKPVVTEMFAGCTALETVEIYALNVSISFQWCPLLSLTTLQFLIKNAANTSTITITVHKDVYAKITDESNTEWNSLIDLASAKNISFVAA